ncbi:hypothetical protein [Erythrobacter sp.]|uniref:hypothetical protein n=1 Tax=Erythrobacter sp. TaxID=1042 RepID=UPI0025CE68BB|nr:hypothetical protein [Erythrobacter sp.]
MLLVAFAAAFATFAAPVLAQHPHPITTRLEGPAPPARGGDGDSVFVAAVRKQAEACGMQNDSLQVTQERFSVEPKTEAEEAALDAKVEAISAKSGATGPKESRQASRAFIRALLTGRLRLMLAYMGEDGEAGMECLVGAMVEAGFATVDPPSSFTQDMADAISDSCGSPRAWMKVEADGTVRFEPPMDADYKVSACLLKGIKESGATKLGFVGNERVPPTEGQADD